MSECVLFKVVGLYELHATLAADVRPDVFVFHHVVLKLAWVLEGFLAFPTPADRSVSISFDLPRKSNTSNPNALFLPPTLSQHILSAFVVPPMVFLWLYMDGRCSPVQGGSAMGGQVSL